MHIQTGRYNLIAHLQMNKSVAGVSSKKQACALNTVVESDAD